MTNEFGISVGETHIVLDMNQGATRIVPVVFARLRDLQPNSWIVTVSAVSGFPSAESVQADIARLNARLNTGRYRLIDLDSGTQDFEGQWLGSICHVTEVDDGDYLEWDGLIIGKGSIPERFWAPEPDSLVDAPVVPWVLPGLSTYFTDRDPYQLFNERRAYRRLIEAIRNGDDSEYHQAAAAYRRVLLSGLLSATRVANMNAELAGIGPLSAE